MGKRRTQEQIKLEIQDKIIHEAIVGTKSMVKIAQEMNYPEAEKITRDKEFMRRYERKRDEWFKQNMIGSSELLYFLSCVVRGEVTDSFGIDASLQDRLKASEMLGKYYKLFSTRLEIQQDVNISDVLSKARRRVNKGKQAEDE